MSKAVYQPSSLRTVRARYWPGAWGSVRTCWRRAASRVTVPQFWPKAMKNCWSPVKLSTFGAALPLSEAWKAS